MCRADDMSAAKTEPYKSIAKTQQTMIGRSTAMIARQFSVLWTSRRPITAHINDQIAPMDVPTNGINAKISPLSQ
jgi:hypothetical protein